MSIITTPIAEQNFEIIRDRIGLILANELYTQSTITYEEGLNPQHVWVERFVPLNHSEMPGVIISMVKGNYTSETQVSQTGVYTYNIDVFFSAKADAENRGDVKATKLLQRMMGVIRAILMDPQYITLGFVRPSINNRRVSDIQIAQPEKTIESTHSVWGRVTLEVTTQEGYVLKDAIALSSFSTSVKLYETSKGYMYSGSAIPPPEPGCAPAKIWVNANEWIEAPSGEVTNITLVDTNMQPVGWLYDGDTIIVQADGDAAPVTTKVNGAATGVSTPAGSELNIDVVNAADVSIGSMTVNTSTQKKISVSSSLISLQGSPLTLLPPTQAKMIVLVDSFGAPLTITPSTDTANSFTGVVSTPIIYIRPMSSGIIASYKDGDEQWVNINNPDPYVPPSLGRPALLDPVNPAKLLFNNAFGHKFRFTGITGGYYDWLTSTYYTVTGVASTEAAEFGTSGAATDYFIDHHTGKAYRWNRLGSATFANLVIAAHGSTIAGFSDFEIPSRPDIESLMFHNGVVNSFVNAKILPFNITLTLKTRTNAATNELTGSHAYTNGTFIVNRSDSTSDSAIIVRNHY